MKSVPFAAYDEVYAQKNPLIGAAFELRLGVYLWRSSMTEQIAAGIFQKLARWGQLTEAEQATTRLFAEQEHNHAELLKALGQEYIKNRPDEYLRALRIPEEPAMLILGVHQAERISSVGFEHMAALGRRLNHADLTAAYELISREERGHLAWGKPVVRRLLRDPELGPAMRAYGRVHPIAREYRAVRPERPWTDRLGGEAEERGQDQVDRDIGAEGLDLRGPLPGGGPSEGREMLAPVGDGGRERSGGPEDVGQGDHAGSLP